jgi:uncharacterized protein YcfL
MNRAVIYLIAMAILVLTMSGCKAKKAVVRKKQPVADHMELIKSITANELDYRNIEIKYSTRAELEGKNYGLNITYRNTKDETLWVSVRAMLGIEAARVIANRDSVWVISRIAQIKEKGSWREMSKLLGYPLDFMAFQNIMTRRLFYPGKEDNGILSTFLKREEGNKIMIVPDFEDGSQRKDADVYGFLPQFIVDKNLRQLNETRLVPEDNEWMLGVEYEEGASTNLGLGSKMIISAMDSQSNLDLDLKIQNVKIDEELKFPFQWF